MTLKKYLAISVLALLAVFLWLFPEWRFLALLLAAGFGALWVAYFAAAVALFKRLSRAFSGQRG